MLPGYVTGDPYWTPDPERTFVEEVGREPGRLRVGIVTGSPLGGVHADCVAAAEDAAALLEELGHFVSPTELALTEDDVRDFQTVWFASLAATQVPDWGETERKTQEQTELSREMQAPDYLRAIPALQRFSLRLVSLWEDHDLLLTPTLAHASQASVPYRHPRGLPRGPDGRRALQILPLHSRLQCDGTAGRLASPLVERRKAANRGAAGGTTCG